MTNTSLLYAATAVGEGLLGQPSAWATVGNATGAPDGAFATNNNASSPGYQRLRLSGYDPQAAILAATGGQQPYSIEYMHVQVKFSLDSATNYDAVDVLLLAADGTPLATRPLYLGDATTGLTVVAAVNFTGHNGFVDSQPLTWSELAGCQIALDATRSGAAGADTLRIDAVGLFVSYTVDPPVDPGEPEPHGGGVTLRAYDRDGRRLGALPWSTLQRTIVRNAAGALTTSVPKSLLDPQMLGEEVYLRVAEDGVEAPDYYLLDDDGDDDADDGGEARPVAIGATGAAAILEWGTVYSWEYEHGVTESLLGLDPTYGFAAATPGKILKTFIELAQARGCFPHLTFSFTDEVDSAGRGWPTLYARDYDVGTTIGKVLASMAEDGWVDWEMTGFRLDLYVPDTALAADYPEIVLHLGRQVTSGPRKRTRKAARSVILANGAEGVMIEAADPDALARLGRREGYEGRNGITDVGTLTAATEVSLQRATTASESITLAMTAAEAPPLPRPGGYIRYNERRLSPTQLEPMRVQSIAWDYSAPVTVSVELADLWVDQDVKLARRVDAILNGSSANERVPVTNPADKIPPDQVEGLALVSAPYEDPTTGQQYAQATASWLAVTRDADGTTVDELAGYTIEWRQPDVGVAVFPVDAIASATNVSWSPVVPGTLIEARIAAYDRYSNYGEWSDWVAVMAGVDETPPTTPSAPVVDNHLGLLRTFWDGGFAGGSARPADVAAVEVHVSALDGFDPNEDPEATRVGTLYASGHVFTDTPYDQTRYVRLVAVDSSGNRSAPSEQASGTTGQIVSADLLSGIIDDSRLLADVALIRTAHIDELNLNSARVSSIDVGKLEAGVMTAAVIMGGRISTADPGPDGTAMRVELNSLGIYRWDGAGPDPVVAIDNSGALLTGTYRSARTGRRIEMGAAGTQGRIDFWSPDGDNGYVRAHTEASGTEAIQVGMHAYADSRVDPLWNVLNINTSANGDYTVLRSGTVEFMYDTNGRNAGGKFVVFSTTNRGGAGAATKQRFIIDSNGAIGMDGSLSIHPNNNGAYLDIPASGDSLNSPHLKFLNASNFGAGWKMHYPGSGTLRLEAMNVNDNGYVNVYGTAFTNSSDARHKRGIASLPPEESMLAAVRATPVRRYHRVHPKAPKGGFPVPEGEGPEEIGLVAQEVLQTLPRIVAEPGSDGSLGIDQYQMTAAVWRAVQELADIVDDLRKGKP